MPGLVDVEVAGQRVFLAASRVNVQNVAPPAAVALGSGAIDPAWTPAALTRRTPDPSGTPYELRPDAPGGVALSERSALSPLPPQFTKKTVPTT